jgi:hypothetical protein
MEEIIDFDEWIKTAQPLNIEYVVVYDPFTGKVTGVGPSYAFETEQYKLPIEQEVAEKIISSEIKIHNCQVNIGSSVLEIAKIKNLNTIDDVLHRIISVAYSDVKTPEIYLTYISENNTIEIQLSNEFGGNKEFSEIKKTRNIVWDGETEMNFLITEYNDPNLIFDMFCVNINELVGKTKIIKNINNDKFSVYTRRLFKNYVIQYK